VYPNATLVIPEIELDFWLAPDPGTEPENVARNRRRTPHNLAPYRDRIIRAREGKEVIGLTPMLAPGHTPGHTIWFGNSGGQRFAAWGDLVHLAAVQLPHPEAAVMYDLDKAASAATRKRVLDMLSADDVLILGAHLDTPGPCRLLRRGTGYAIELAPGGLIAG
jgi:glyoxylase-like metal-dependent hydrolase (beta-lactamase superfamily II)